MQITISSPTELPFLAFICYRRDSGEDFAEHLKNWLEEFQLRTFLDVTDIPGQFKGTQKWVNIRDKAIRECKIFILVITPGFESSEEIKKEFRLAKKSSDKVFVCFRHKDVARNLCLNLGNEKVELSNYQQISFDTKEDLLRKAYKVLIKRADHT
jgi:hypothetical protein